MELFSRAARYFDAVASQGSVRAAAKQMHVAASAINRHILDLEEELGVQLFDRTPQGLRLSVAGELLIHRLRACRADLTRAEEQISDIRQLKRGRVRIATIESLVTSSLPKLMTDFRLKHGNVDFEVEVCPALSVVERVELGECDIGITYTAPPNRSLRRAIAIACRIGAVMAPSHKLAGLKSMHLYDLAGHPLAISSRWVNLREIISIVEDRSSFTLEKSFQTNSITLLKSLAASGAAITILNDTDVTDEIAAGTLVHVPIIDPEVAIQTLAVISHSAYSHSIAVHRFIDHMQRAFGLSPVSIVGAEMD